MDSYVTFWLGKIHDEYLFSLLTAFSDRLVLAGDSELEVLHPNKNINIDMMEYFFVCDENQQIYRNSSHQLTSYANEVSFLDNPLQLDKLEHHSSISFSEFFKAAGGIDISGSSVVINLQSMPLKLLQCFLESTKDFENTTITFLIDLNYSHRNQIGEDHIVSEFSSFFFTVRQQVTIGSIRMVTFYRIGRYESEQRKLKSLQELPIALEYEKRKNSAIELTLSEKKVELEILNTEIESCKKELDAERSTVLEQDKTIQRLELLVERVASENFNLLLDCSRKIAGK